ncbi:hypothetical protein [Methylobacterium sp. Leaf469]|uniref:hypothetical protein n=1 Tax=Methylobacterium sp. Leaf469 TaxID=1736387 RepID=UPI000B13D077|nr:hypothetical protein [Methylobacterium sp. Leaf469]
MRRRSADTSRHASDISRTEKAESTLPLSRHCAKSQRCARSEHGRLASALVWSTAHHNPLVDAVLELVGQESARPSADPR